jgi:ligand-binding sensor domain-containing protein
MKNRAMPCLFVTVFLILCGTGGAFSQTDFWQKATPPLGRTVNSVASNAISDVFVGTDSGVFRSSDNGGTWTNSGLNPGGGYSVITSRGAIFAAGSDSAYYTTDNGASWKHLNHFFLIGNPVAISDSVDIFIGVGNPLGGIGVVRSTDDGATWVGLGWDAGLRAMSYALAINASGTIFSGGYGGVGACVYRSTDNGSSWTTTFSSKLFSRVNALAISAAGHIFAGTPSVGVLHSTDDGAHWLPSNGDFGTSQVIRLAINANGHVFAVVNSASPPYAGLGVYRSTDDGASWAAVNSGLTSLNVTSLAVTPKGTAFAVTDSGLFRSVQSTTAVREFSADAPASFSLGQNYPNPFNPSTVVSYRLPVVSNVKLAIYDLLGREVAVLVDEIKKAGTYEVRFDGSHLASGVYFYRIQAEGFTKARRLLLLK